MRITPRLLTWRARARSGRPGLPRAVAAAIGLGAAVAALAAPLAAPLAAQEYSLPFAVGEALTYQVRVQRVGDVGTGKMWIEGPVVEQGVPSGGCASR